MCIEVIAGHVSFMTVQLFFFNSRVIVFALKLALHQFGNSVLLDNVCVVHFLYSFTSQQLVSVCLRWASQTEYSVGSCHN